MSKFVKLDSDFSNFVVLPIQYFLAGSAPATAANHPINLFVAPYPCQVVSVVLRFGTTSTSGTFDLRKAPSGTATASGTSVLSATISMAGTASVNASGTMSPTASVLNTGDCLGVVTGGTLTNLADLGVTIVIKPLR